ncbi:MAG: PTS fructose transporter subunit IIA [Pseudomonadota bacterium]
MSRLLLITHGDIGQSLLGQAEAVLGPLNLPVEVLSIPVGGDLQAAREAGSALLVARRRDTVLVTDIFGATPSNIARELAGDDVPVVHGLNLAMLLRAHCYAAYLPEKLAFMLVEGGRQSIFAGHEPPQDEHA